MSFNGSTIAQVITALQTAFVTYGAGNPSREYSTTTTATSLTLTYTFTGQTPLANIVITQQGLDTSNMNATFAIPRVIVNDGLNRGVTTGTLSTITATVGSTPLTSVSITSGSTLDQLVTQLSNSLPPLTCLLYTSPSPRD